MLRPVLALVALPLLLPAQVPADQWGPAAGLVQEHCADCHDADARKGGLDLDALARAATADRLWTLARMRDRVVTGEMPPPEKSELAPAQRERLASWLTSRVLAEVPDLAAEPGRVTVRRLSRTHYENAVRDLFGVATPATAAFPADDLGYGFDSIGDALTFSTLHLEKYLAAAADIARQVIDTEDPDRPTARRLEAEQMRLVDGPGAGLDGDVANLYTRATLEQAVDLPRDGVYRLTVLCFGDQAGDQPCRMALRIDGRELEVFEVPERQPARKELTAPLTGGAHRIALAFLNDYYEPTHPDPKQRDRNLRIDWLEVVGPLDRPVVPAQQRWLHDADPGRGRPAARARPILQELLARAWRRPPTTAEVDRLARLVEQAMAAGGSFAAGMRLGLQAALSSPHFLFRIETGGIEGRAGAAAPVGGHALASRLSFLLWASVPDDELRELARRNRLADPAVLAAQVDRMLADPRAEALATDFAAQWLELRNLAERTPDPERFPGFDDGLRTAMRRESELLFLAVLREDRDVRQLLDCDFTHVDATLARFYGIPGQFGADFVRVELPPELRQRGGLLGHASIHAVTANPTRTSPVKRGKWVLENLLDAAPPPPPPGNDSFTGEAEIDSAASLRQQMAAHRERTSCAACHVRMDALGLALEHFDAIGRHRVTDAGGAIDASGQLPDGRVIDGLTGLKTALRDDPAFLRCLLHKLFVYAVGREAVAADRVRLWAEAEALRQRPQVTLRELIHVIVRLDAFRLRTVGR